jgi:spermidine synthase
VIRAIHFADFPSVHFVAQEDRTGVVALRKQDRIVAFEQEARVVGVSRLHIDGATHGLGDVPNEQGDVPVRLALARVSQPRRILSIGLGDGLMCSTALTDSVVSELVVVELNAALANVLAHTARGRMVISSPKVTSINDDGRRWLAANPAERFDMIMMFPLHPAHAYYGNLFSKEFFELTAAHLTPSGMLVARSVDLFSTPRTLIEVFEHVVRVEASGYIASRAPLVFDASRLPVPASEFTKLIEADRATIAAHTGDAPLNLDLRPNSEYYLTYPYAWSLATTGYPRERLYVDKNPTRFAGLIASSPANAAGARSPPAKGSSLDDGAAPP